MAKRKNDFLDQGTPRWVWFLAPVLLLVIGGAGLLFGQMLARQNMYVLLPPPEVYLPTVTPAVRSDGLIPVVRSSRVRLDVAFVLDTTGSMDDELAQLQNNILNISNQMAQFNLPVEIRYGLVAYKDRDDEYLTSITPFTDDVAAFQGALAALSAAGGGDTPEDLAAALDDALNQLQWRTGPDAINLIFIVTDASAQLYTDTNIPSYRDSLLTAAERGIKIHTLASSGLDPVGEYMLRQASQITMGRFIFLTYDSAAPVAAAPGEDRPDLNVGEAVDEQGIGEYTVEDLPNLVLRLIREEVTAAVGMTQP